MKKLNFLFFITLIATALMGAQGCNGGDSSGGQGSSSNSTASVHVEDQDGTPIFGVQVSNNNNGKLSFKTDAEGNTFIFCKPGEQLILEVLDPIIGGGFETLAGPFEIECPKTGVITLVVDFTN